jgi:hypothetical protein
LSEVSTAASNKVGQSVAKLTPCSHILLLGGCPCVAMETYNTMITYI